MKMFAPTQTFARAEAAAYGTAFQPGLLLRSREEVDHAFAEYKRHARAPRRKTVASAASFVPVILGPLGPERVGERVAQVLIKTLQQREHVDTTFFEIQASKPEADRQTLNMLCEHADAMLLVLPEYNYGSSPAFHELLRVALRQARRKVIGVCDLSPGWLGGLRVLQDLMPAMRQGRIIPLLWDERLAHRQNWLEDFGQWREEKYRAPLENFLREVLSLAATLRHAPQQNLS